MGELTAPELKPEQILILNQKADDTSQQVRGYETDYFTTKGPKTYLQVLLSTFPLPEGTGGQLPLEALPNRLDEKPTDQFFSPEMLGWVFPKLPFAFEIHSKERDEQVGFALIFSFRIDGFLYRREDNFLAERAPVKGEWSYVDEKSILDYREIK